MKGNAKCKNFRFVPAFGGLRGNVHGLCTSSQHSPSTTPSAACDNFLTRALPLIPCRHSCWVRLSTWSLHLSPNCSDTRWRLITFLDGSETHYPNRRRWVLIPLTPFHIGQFNWWTILRPRTFCRRFSPFFALVTQVRLLVLSDILQAVNCGDFAALVFLDLSAAFDMVDHDILLQRLQLSYGIHGSVLQWFLSYLLGQAQHVHRGICGSARSSAFIWYVMYHRALWLVRFSSSYTRRTRMHLLKVSGCRHISMRKTRRFLALVHNYMLTGFCRQLPTASLLSPSGCSPTACNSMITRRSSCGAQLTVANIACRLSVLLPLVLSAWRQRLRFVILVSTTQTCQCAVMSGELCRAVSLFYASCVPSGVKYQLLCSTHW